MVTATFTGNSIVVTFEENPENQAESYYEIEYQCANKVVPHTIDQTKNIGINPSNGMRIYSDTLLYEEHVAAGLTRTPTIKLYTIDANQKRSGAYTIEASNPPPAAPSFQSEVSHNLIIMNFYPGTDSDFVGYHVWASETSPVAKTTENEKAFGPNPIVSFAAEPSTTYYVRYSGYDAFGDDGALEIEVEITTPSDPALDAFSELNEELTEAQGQLADLIATYGDTASASASAEAAQEALDDALAAALEADGHATVASTKRDEATGAATSAAASAVTARNAAVQAFPTTFEGVISQSDPVYFEGDGGNPSLTNYAPGSSGSYGPYVQNIVSTTYSIVSRKGRSPNFNGKRWKIRALVAHVSGTPAAVALRLERWNSATGGTQVAIQDMGVGVVSSTTPVWVEYTHVAGNSPFVKPTIIGNYPGSPTAIQRVYALELVDVEAAEIAIAQAGIATAQAASASDSAASATTQANLSAAYSTNARLTASSQLPSTFTDSGLFFGQGYNGEPSTIAPLANPFTGGLFTDVAGVGRVAQINTGAAFDICNVGAMQVQSGRVYRATFRHRTLSGTRPLDLYMITMTSWIFGSAAGNNTSVTSTTTWQTHTLTVTGDVLLAAGRTHIRAMGRATAGSSAVQWAVIGVEDVTESVNATTQAGIATTQASLANDKAAVATTQSNLSATYANEARANAQTFGLTPNADFKDGMSLWYRDVGATLAPANGTWYPNNTLALGSWESTVGVGSNLYSSLMPIDPINRKYRIRGRIYSNGLNGGGVYIGATSHNANGAAIGSNAGHAYIAGWQNQVKPTGWHDIESEVLTGVGATADLAAWFRAGTKQVRLCAFLNYANLGASQFFILDSLWLEDVTESEQAASSASISSTNAAIATAASAAAQQSATLAANMVPGFINPNSSFDDFPSNATGALPASWSGTGTHTSYRVADPRGGWAWRLVGIAGSDTYAQSAYTATKIVNQNDYLVFEGECQLNSGSFSGAGILLYILSSAGSVLESVYIQCAVDKDSSNTVVGAGVAGRTYRFQKLYRVTNANAHGVQVYAMSHWSALGSVAAANDITWFKAGVRVATNAEIAAGVALPSLEATVSSQSTVLATHTTQLASRLESVTAGPSSATLKMTALNSSGGAASQIALQADEIKLGTSGGGLTINGGKATFTGELNVGNDTGQRVKITSNLIEVYNASGVRLIRLGIW